jgi:hypothetical protein
MKRILRFAAIALAIISPAFANDTGDSEQTQKINESELRFISQTSSRYSTPAMMRGSISPDSWLVKTRAATAQGFAPIDTDNLGRGSNR